MIEPIGPHVTSLYGLWVQVEPRTKYAAIYNLQVVMHMYLNG